METSYTEARRNLASLMDRATEGREVVFIRRRGREPVALVAADELASLRPPTSFARPETRPGF